MIQKSTIDPSVAARAGLVVLACAGLFLAGCGDRTKDKPASQAAAKVNKEEITVHQINYVLRQRPVPAEQAASASRQVLERLIDQELALQQAHELKLDRDPQILQQVEASRRDIISRAYVEKVGADTPKPTADEVKQYIDSHPALFRERRVYSFQDLAVEARPEQIEGLRAKVAGAKNGEELVTQLKAAGFKFTSNPVVKTAEQLPLGNLETFARMKDGEALFNPAPTGAQVLILVESRRQPIDEQRAWPLVEQFLLNERKRKSVEDNLKTLRSVAKVEYIGEFVGGPNAAPVAAPSAAALPAAVASDAALAK